MGHKSYLTYGCQEVTNTVTEGRQFIIIIYLGKIGNFLTIPKPVTTATDDILRTFFQRTLHVNPLLSRQFT